MAALKLMSDSVEASEALSYEKQHKCEELHEDIECKDDDESKFQNAKMAHKRQG